MKPREAKRTLDQIRSASASFEARASLELRLLELLAAGEDRVAAYLDAIPGYLFSRHPSSDRPGETRFVDRQADPALVVTTFASAASNSVDVETDQQAKQSAEPSPPHAAFYSIRESLGEVSDDDVENLQSPLREVFLIGLLEAEVMNGGFGQYLANTEGRYLRETSDCLRRIGATTTDSLLARAEAIAEKHESFVAAWEAASSAFSALDGQFLDAAEDLAGLTADTLGLA